MKIFMFLSILFLFACGDDEPSSSSVADNEGFMRFTLTGDRLDEPVVFEKNATSLGAIYSGSEVKVLARNNDFKSGDKEFTFDQLTMTFEKKTGTYSHGSFESIFTFSGPFNEDGSKGTFSIKQSATDSGSITVTEVGERTRGTFSIKGFPTQGDNDDLVFQIEGEFNFWRCDKLVCT